VQLIRETNDGFTAARPLWGMVGEAGYDAEHAQHCYGACKAGTKLAKCQNYKGPIRMPVSLPAHVCETFNEVLSYL